MKLVLLLTALLAITCTSVAGQQLDTTKLNQLFDALEQRNEAMGSLVISQKGDILYRRAIGMREFAKGNNMHADITTNYRIWSVTKVYTATMILQLVEEGRLSLTSDPGLGVRRCD